MEAAIKRNLSPKEIQADSLYGSDENYQAAQSDGIVLVSPTMGTIKKEKLSLTDFNLAADGQIITCPQGHALVFKKIKKGRITQGFPLDTCMGCPQLEDCPVKPGKKYAYNRYTAKSVRIAQEELMNRQMSSEIDIAGEPESKRQCPSMTMTANGGCHKAIHSNY